MSISDVFIVSATLLGPILAVQAQKWIERTRDAAKRREYLFHSLMATRGTRLDVDHVRALNMIDVLYYDNGGIFKNKKLEAVRNKWRVYLDSLGEDASKFEGARLDAFYAQRDDLFIDLLESLANERGVTFDRVTLKKGGYHPVAMGSAFAESNALRTSALAVLSGQRAIKVAVDPPPLDAGTE